MTIAADIELDLSGLMCPMPLLKAKLALNSLEPEKVLKVIATDPGSEKDFLLFAKQSDNKILEFSKSDAAFTYWIQKG